MQHLLTGDYVSDMTTKPGYDANDIHVQMKLMTHITGLFNRNLELENIIAPRLDEYDRLINAYRDLLKDTLLVSMSISRQSQSQFTEITSGMLTAMISVARASMEHWEKLKGKAHGTTKYSFFDNRRDIKHIAELVKERQHWGQKMNELNQSIMRENKT